MRRSWTNAMVVVIALVWLGMGPGAVRGDIPPWPPNPPAGPTLAGGAVPRPLHVIVAGLALAAAIAGAGVWLARGSGRSHRVSGLGMMVAATAILSGAALLAYWSYAALRSYEAEKARLDAEYQARLRDWRPNGPVRQPGRAAVPEAPPTAPAPSRS